MNQAISDIDIPVVRYECKSTTVRQNLIQMSRAVLSAFRDPLSDHIFSGYDDLFQYVFEKSCTQKSVFLIDEFSFLPPSDQAVDSALAVAIDSWKNRSRMKPAIFGSHVRILKEIISANEHLFGGFTHILSLSSMDYLTSSLFILNIRMRIK